MNENLPAVIQTAIQNQKIDITKVNLLLPTQTIGTLMGKYEKLTVEIVKIDPNPKNGETHIIDGKITLGKVALLKISNAVGIKWHPELTGLIESTKMKSIARAVAVMQKPNGETLIVPETKTIDCELYYDDQYMKNEEEAEKGKIIEWKKNPRTNKPYPVFGEWESDKEKRDYIERKTKKAVLQKRKDKDQLASTMAKLRAIRFVLAIKSHYTEKELEKPLAIPRISLDANKLLSDEETKGKAINNMLNSANMFMPQNAIDEKIEKKDIEADYEIVQEIEDQSDEPGNTEEPQSQRLSFEVDFDDDIPFFDKDKEKETVEKRIEKEIRSLLDDPDMPEEKKEYYTKWLEESPNAEKTDQLEKVVSLLRGGLSNIKKRKGI